MLSASRFHVAPDITVILGFVSVALKTSSPFPFFWLKG